MTHPRQPHPEEPWGRQPQETRHSGHGRPENGPQPRQGGPPADFGRPTGRHSGPSHPGPTDPRVPLDTWQAPAWPDAPDAPHPQVRPDPDFRDARVWPDHAHSRQAQGWPDQADTREAQAWPDQPDTRQPQGWPDQPDFRDARGWPDQVSSRQAQGWPEQSDSRQAWPDQFGMAPGPSEFALPRRRNPALIIGLSVGLAVVLLGGGAVGAVSYLNAGGKLAPAEPSTAPTLPTTAPWQSDAPADTPAEEPSEAPTEWDIGPSDPPPTSDAGPTDSPLTSDRAAAGSPIAHTEFEDWRFSWEGLRFSAKKAGGWTYDTCDPVDGQGLLARNKCERAIQVAYTAYRGHLKAVQVMMSFPTAKAAKSAADRLSKLNSTALNTRRDMTLDTFEYGMIRTNFSKNYVVATIVTADKTAKPRAEKFHLYLHAYAASYLLLRDVTVTA